MKTIAVVPMKLNNQRLPQKNTKAFTNGKPLCYYILSTLLKVEGIDEVYVYCSNPDIKRFLPEGVKYLERSTLLDQDTTKMNEVLQSFAHDVPADIYIMTHTTAPFISKESIQKGLYAVQSNQYDSAFAAQKLQEFLWENNVPFNYELNNIPRTQDILPLYKETSGFYIYRANIINKLNRRIGNNPYIVEVGKVESIDIDEPEDFEIADAIFNYTILNDSKEKVVEHLSLK
ncbi:cytidylyltransferase domain-containing protein [Priestia megaterium]|uniref:acylneuraminate cytidylyltransferase family protein n=1 Tax=Priestia megaterium TaxID=1404 RepID=UPI0039AECFF2